MTLVIGTRGSALALAQARIVAAALGAGVELRGVRTAGDASERPIAELGDGAFVAALEDALRRGEVDVAVHSLKDLPTEERSDLVIAAIPAREDPRDVLVTRERGGLRTLPRGAVVGTSSPRRAAFLRALRPDIETREIRGNVDTRLRKVREGQYDAIVIALAGLRRLGVAVAADEILDAADCPPAPGQGALAVQCRASDGDVRARVAALDDANTRRAVSAERALLRALGASCEIPLGTFARVEGGEIVLDATLVTGSGVLRARERGSDPSDVAMRAAAALGAVAHA
ncbi:MAG: hydroxymethylbilane synthase [Chloroflexota bacterium]